MTENPMRLPWSVHDCEENGRKVFDCDGDQIFIDSYLDEICLAMNSHVPLLVELEKLVSAYESGLAKRNPALHYFYKIVKQIEAENYD